MNTYNFLGAPVPTIAYCILHQSNGSVSEDVYAATMKSMHDRVQTEMNQVKAALLNGIRDLTVRESQMLLGSLFQYLETPIQSDQQEIKRIFAETLERYRSQASPGGTVGLLSSSEGKICYPSFKKALDRRLLQNGRAYLQELGFTPEAVGCPVFESEFIVEGAVNLDLIEHVVRDRLGIYAAPHGQHLHESSCYIFSVFNQVESRGNPPAPGSQNGKFELSVALTKPAIQYDEFRGHLGKAIDAVMEGAAPLRASLWQRKLGLGRGREFILRFLCEDAKKCEGVVQVLHDDSSPAFPAGPLVDQGALLLKQMS